GRPHVGTRGLCRRSGSRRRAVRDSASRNRRSHPEVDDAGRTHSAAPRPDARINLHHGRLRYRTVGLTANDANSLALFAPFAVSFLWYKKPFLSPIPSSTPSLRTSVQRTFNGSSTIIFLMTVSDCPGMGYRQRHGSPARRL